MSNPYYYRKDEVLELVHNAQNKAIEISTWSISNELAIIWLFIWVVWVVLWFFIQDLYKKTIKTRTEIQVIDDFIKDKTSEYFNKIKQAEISSILDNIVQNPINFTHVRWVLLTFKIEWESNFFKLLELYKQEDIKSDIMLMLLQHYPEKVFTDDQLWGDLSENEFDICEGYIFGQWEFDELKSRIFWMYRSNVAIHQEKYDKFNTVFINKISIQ